MDITTDGFGKTYICVYIHIVVYTLHVILTMYDCMYVLGYMLAFGDLAWVPFIYSLQARYLVSFNPIPPPYLTSADLTLT